MTSRAAIIRCARTYLNTPFHHMGRRKGVALDCGGLISGVHDEIMRVKNKSVRVYSQYPDGTTLQSIMDEYFSQTCIKCAGPGDIVGYWYDQRNVLQHLGILSNIGIIHAYANAKRCVETSIPRKLAKRFMIAWKFPDVEPVNDFEIADLTDETDPLQYYIRGCCK